VLVEVGHLLRVHIRAGCLSWRGYRLCRGLLHWADRPHAHRHATHLVHPLLRRALGQAIRPRTPRDCRLPAGTVRPPGYACRPGRARGRPARWARQLMPWIRGHDRFDRRDLDHVMTPWRGSVSREGGLAVRALRGLDDLHLIDFFSRDQGTWRARMARLTATTALPPRAMGTLRQWRIARRRTGGIA